MTLTNAKPCKKACRECPFRRTSVPGWLGSASFDPNPGQSFLVQHWFQDVPLPCHMQVNWEKDDSQEQATVKPLCYGLLTMMKNSCKMPHDRGLAAAVAAMERDPEFFSFPQEFYDHHNGGLKP